jgi:hypothetical protein
VKVVLEHRGAEAPDPFTFRLRTCTKPDGEAFWFENCAPSIDPSIEEQVIAIKASNPGLSGRKALDALRKSGAKVKDDDFWRWW